MLKFNFKLKLTSDCEGGSGIGTELINSVVPRNIDGYPIIGASHLKGLMRQNLVDMLSALFPEQAEEATGVVLGCAGADGNDGSPSAIALSDAVADKKNVITITRTSLNEYGTADDGSLRSVQAVPVGTVYSGMLMVNSKKDSIEEKLALLALLSVTGVGANRNRGGGNCVINIEGENYSPGALLKEVARLIKTDSISARKKLEVSEESVLFSGKRELLHLSFTAESPICCPEHPVVGNNVIKTGFAIPASAVQGVVLNLLSGIDNSLATACFSSEWFRAFPLHPVTDENSAISLRISSTHKISKLADSNGEFIFNDSMIDGSYDWKNQAHNSPLKGVDGVLSYNNDSEDILLWRSADMPRIISGHSVHNCTGSDKERNLYSVEAMAPLRYSGIISIPEEASKVLLNAIGSGRNVSIGKSKSVRGMGVLKAERVTSKGFLHSAKIDGEANRLFIVQSPIMVEYSDIDTKSAEEILAEYVKAASWGEVESASASLTTIFGWNRHGLGRKSAGSNRLAASVTIAPGSVFLLKKPVDNLSACLERGIGGGKEQGFGAVLPHPGKAGKKFTGPPSKRKFKSETNAAIEGYKLHSKSSKSIASSQIAALLAQCETGLDAGKNYLDRQKFNRPARIWDSWKSVYDDLTIFLNGESEVGTDGVLKMLRVWHDLSCSKK